MKTFITWCLLLPLLLLGAYTGALSPGSYSCITLRMIDGSSQPYGLYLPTPYVAATPHPVIFIAHGFGGSGPPISTARRCILPMPTACCWCNCQGRGNTFYDGVGEVDFYEVLADLRARYNIDLRRLYLEGASMGATGAYRMGIRHPDIFRRGRRGGWLGGLSFLVHPVVWAGERSLLCRTFPPAQPVDGLRRGRGGKCALATPVPDRRQL